jgi:DNA-directed RNA polymerase specialized sigma24 family protein
VDEDMTAEQYLRQIEKLDTKIAIKQKEYARLVASASSMAGFSSGERVQSTRNLHRGADTIAEYIDVEREINALKSKKKAILDTLQRLPSKEYRLLYRVYVEGAMIKELPSEFKKSYSWVQMKKRKALEHLQTILDERSNE